LARLGALFAQANMGELFALHVVKVPPQMGVTDGRAFLRQGRPLLEEVIAIGREYDVPVRTMLRLGRDIGNSIVSAAKDREANLLLFGWPGYTQNKGMAFGSIIDLLTSNPPCDLAVVRLRRTGLPGKILVPIAGGPNARLAVELAITEADAVEQITGNRPEVVALNLLLDGEQESNHKQRRLELLEELQSENWPVELRIKPADDIVMGILQEASSVDQIIIGASEERLLEQSLFGSIPQRVAEEALCTVLMVKRHDPVRFGLRRWLISPRKLSVKSKSVE